MDFFVLGFPFACRHQISRTVALFERPAPSGRWHETFSSASKGQEARRNPVRLNSPRSKASETTEAKWRSPTHEQRKPRKKNSPNSFPFKGDPHCWEGNYNFSRGAPGSGRPDAACAASRSCCSWNLQSALRHYASRSQRQTKNLEGWKTMCLCLGCLFFVNSIWEEQGSPEIGEGVWLLSTGTWAGSKTTTLETL